MAKLPADFLEGLASLSDRAAKADALEGEPWDDSLIYLPPWRDRAADGTLTGEYGPETKGALAYLWETFEESIHGVGSGGLWDPAAAATPSALKRAATRALQRCDSAGVLAHLAAHGETLPKREREAVRAFYSGKSHATIAREMGVGASTVREWLRRTRQRVKLEGGK